MGTAKVVGYALERPTAVSARYEDMVGLVETMLKLHKDLPKAKPPHVWADGLRLPAYGRGEASN